MVKQKTSGKPALLIAPLILLLLLCAQSSFSQLSQSDQDSLMRAKQAQLKGYTNIFMLMQKEGYKRKQMLVPDERISFIRNLEGPLEPTILPASRHTSWRKYDVGSSSRLVIYLTDTVSSWLGIVSGLKAQGIPFRVTTDINEAIKHTVVLVYPAMNSKRINMETFKKLRDHPKNGGVLIGFNVQAPSMYPTFGFGKTMYSSQRDEVIIRNFTLPETNFIEDLKEAVLKIGNLSAAAISMTTIGYTETAYHPIAVFKDGSAAIVRSLYNKGACYAFGFDLGFLTIMAHANLDPEIQRTYVNDFEPTLDVLYRMIKGIYIENIEYPILSGTVPENKKVPILFTHDIDYTKSIDSMLFYAEMEKRHNVSATYFVQTKYVKDGMDQAFLNEKYIPYFIALKNMGMELGSHSVSHTPYLEHIPLGSGLEKYPDYRPFYATYISTFNESLFGELRVSHFLLDEVFNNNTTSFRSGFLNFPEKLHAVMQEVGFKYGSNITANNVLTHMPFNPMNDFFFDEELEVIEIPVTIEDEYPPEMDQRLDAAIVLTEKISRYGGVVNILIHPNVLGHKFRFQEQFTEYYKDEAWFGTVSQFGDWWNAKIAMQIDVYKYDILIKVKIDAPLPLNGFPLMVPESLKLIAMIPEQSDVEKTEGGYLFKKLEGQVELIFEEKSTHLSK